jgi:hypothetical protein
MSFDAHARDNEPRHLDCDACELPWNEQAEYSNFNESAEEELEQLLARFGQVHAEASAKVSKWSKQTRRMESEMTKLVHIKTKALEDRKTLQARA